MSALERKREIVRKRVASLPDISNVPLSELQRIAGLLLCEQMLYARPPDAEAEINRRINILQDEIDRRLAVPTLEQTG